MLDVRAIPGVIDHRWCGRGLRCAYGSDGVAT